MVTQSGTVANPLYTVTGGRDRSPKMNPNGIVFSPTAKLEMGGSVVDTTARSIQFADRSQFDVGRSGNGLLSINLPIG